MWTCSSCGRIFQKTNQPHSCKGIPLENHFINKEKANIIFKSLVKQIENKIGKCKIISLPCCVHLFGTYDFLAVLPKKETLEIRFGLNRKLASPRMKQIVPVGKKIFKHCLNLNDVKEIDEELFGWLTQAYGLKN